MTEPGFQPARARLARELQGWKQVDVAEGLGTTAAAVSQFESGSTRPGPETLGRLAELLKVPQAFFFLPVVETHEGFFRSLRRTSVTQRRRARAVAHIAHDIAVEAAALGLLAEPSVPEFPVDDLDADEDVLEDIAAQVRRRWKVPPGPLSDVVGLLEDHGVMVIRLPLVTGDVDAFSLPFRDHPVVVLGSDKNDRARSRFDAAHELGHLVLHGDHLWGVKEVEAQAHRFAAALLMPADEIHDELPSRADWPKLFELKRIWQVSLAALLMRAKTLGRMSESDYLTAIKAASARGWRRREPVPLGMPEQPGQLGRFLDLDPRLVESLPPDVLQALRGATAA